MEKESYVGLNDWEIERIKKEEIKNLQRKYHSRLYDWITRVGVARPKRHGRYWDAEVDNVKYHLDDYSSSIQIDDFHVGSDFGGFTSYMEPNMYRYHIGILYQYWLKNQKTPNIRKVTLK